MKNKMNGPARLALTIFGVTVIIVNAGLSYAFGFTYLGNAFGISGWISNYMGGIYAVLIADIAFLVWFWAYQRIAESKNQRWISSYVGAVALVLSIAMSINQLAVHSYGLVDLTIYHESVGLVSLAIVIIVTAVHIVATAVFQLADPDEAVKTKGIEIRADLIEETLNGVEKSMDDIRLELIEEMTTAVKRDVLQELGFGPGSNRAPGKFQPIPTKEGVVSSSNGRGGKQR